MRKKKTFIIKYEPTVDFRMCLKFQYCILNLQKKGESLERTMVKEVTGGGDCPAFVLPKSSSDIAEMKKVAEDLIGGTTCAGSLGSFFRKKRIVSSSACTHVDDTMEKIVSVSSENSGADINLNIKSPVKFCYLWKDRVVQSDNI